MSMKQATLQIQGMTCTGCVSSIKKAIAEQQGVSHLNIDLQTGAASFIFDDNKISLDDIKQLIDDAGFDVA